MKEIQLYRLPLAILYASGSFVVSRKPRDSRVVP
ncbi:hypothetical protein RUMTOR_02626 [[Ruminococcus] torques ATCC 27756]|uniref:Uncharacterized protein n=1 Tax=[Ruminococcus] torques ATCC 27756 TaxID=411460 RepID=A5KQT5_9FIRM|nr:hypothetical protein RUMTOR_02913 [[Ruminococcus] torques ATCC 27756]EDK23253.1 hypothetical protein RUMTOR_02626 [[Ruminococcus] torques ATCC 27756]